MVRDPLTGRFVADPFAPQTTIDAQALIEKGVQAAMDYRAALASGDDGENVLSGEIDINMGELDERI